MIEYIFKINNPEHSLKNKRQQQKIDYFRKCQKYFCETAIISKNLEIIRDNSIPF